MNGTEGAININLKGIGVGDGFTDPKTIMSTLGVFAFNLGYLDVQERYIRIIKLIFAFNILEIKLFIFIKSLGRILHFERESAHFELVMDIGSVIFR